MQKDNYLYLFKYILVGDSSVGKSCLLLSFLSGQFRRNHDPTIGLNFGAKTLVIDNKTFKLHIYDTAGQEQFKSLTRQYFKSAIGCIFCYDVTNKESFLHLERWIQDAKDNSNESLISIILGNKIDLASREVTFEQGQELADKYQMLFFETSAKTNSNIELAFNQLTEQIYNQIMSGQIDVKKLISQGIVKQGSEMNHPEIVQNRNPQLKADKKKDDEKTCKC